MRLKSSVIVYLLTMKNNTWITGAVLALTSFALLASCEKESNAEEKDVSTTITPAAEREDMLTREEKQRKTSNMQFLEENRLREEVMVTPSGLQYEVLRKGEGPSPDKNHQITAHYTGMLINGKVFDSSVERNEPLVFGLDQVIKGWGEGLQLMNKGAKYKFYIPYHLAYGEQGIPRCNSSIFDPDF